MKNLRFFSLLLFTLALGCDSSVGVSEDGYVSGVVTTPSEPLKVSESPTLVIFDNDEEGNQKGGVQNLNPKDVDELEEMIRAVDWERERYGPEIALVHLAHVDTIRAFGSFGAIAKDDMVKMKVTFDDLDGMHHGLICDSIDSLDQIVSMFKSYYLGDDRWRTEVVWKTE